VKETGLEMQRRFAPGARVTVRDEDWVIRRIDLSDDGGHALTCDGLSELVRGTSAIFLDRLEDDILVHDPAQTELFQDTSEYFTDTWYDQTGRIVFTPSKGLIGVGLPRKARQADLGPASPLGSKHRNGRSRASHWAGRRCATCPPTARSPRPSPTTPCPAARCSAPSSTRPPSSVPTTRRTTGSLGRFFSKTDSEVAPCVQDA
jgi:hypothetical protein